MQQSVVPIFIALILAAAMLIYIARPIETPEQFAKRMCTESRTSGISFEKCVEGRVLQHLAGRQDN
jgi:hypothetical protein